MKKIAGIIFDLDGVLLSTDQYHYLAWKRLADELEIPFDRRDNEKLRGVSRMESLEIVLSRRPSLKLTDAEKLACAERKNADYREYLGQMTPADVSDEVRETLAVLRRRGYRLAVGSSSKNARFILEQTKLTDAFDAIADGTDISRSKPDPEVFLTAADFLGLEPTACAVVEDAIAGLEAAKGGDMLAIAIGSAAGDRLADLSITQFSELTEYFHALSAE